MTTIACNKESMAGDLQFTNIKDFSKWKGKTKVFKFKAHELHYPHADFIVGFAGTAADIIEVADYFDFPERWDKLPRVRGLAGLVLTADKKIFCFDDYAKWLKVEADYHAIGSGGPIALGVLANNGSPKEAIRAAMRHDSFTGFGVKELKF